MAEEYQVKAPESGNVPLEKSNGFIYFAESGNVVHKVFQSMLEFGGMAGAVVGAAEQEFTASGIGFLVYLGGRMYGGIMDGRDKLKLDRRISELEKKLKE